MFDRESLPTITESVVESADSAAEWTNSTTVSAADPVVGSVHRITVTGRIKAPFLV